MMMMMFYRRQPSRRAFVELIFATTTITTSITTRARDGVAGLVLNNNNDNDNTKSSTSGILLINRRGIAGHSNNNRQQQQNQQQNNSQNQMETYVGGNRARVIPSHQLTLAQTTNPLLYRKLIRKLMPGVPLSKPGERQTVALEDFMKEFQVLHVNRGAAGGMSSSSPSSSATARGGRGGDGRDLLVMSKGAKLVGARKRTARFFSPTFDGSSNSTSVEGGNSDGRGGGGGGGGGGEGGDRQHHSKSMWQKYRFYAFMLGCALSFYAYRESVKETENLEKQNYTTEKEYEIENWSGTKKVVVDTFTQPETTEALEAIVRHASLRGKKIRPVGAALSPNGVAFEKEGMVSLALLDKVLHVDEEKKQVTVQPGARVSDVTEALRKYNLTLQNYASIREQQIGGFTQVGAHGTGAKIPPVDATVVRMK